MKENKFVIIKSPEQRLRDLLFLPRFFLLLLSLPNKVWGTYCFCSVSYYYQVSQAKFGGLIVFAPFLIIIFIIIILILSFRKA